MWATILDSLLPHEKEGILKTCSMIPSFTGSCSSNEPMSSMIAKWDQMPVLMRMEHIQVLYSAILFLQSEQLLPDFNALLRGSPNGYKRKRGRPPKTYPEQINMPYTVASSAERPPSRSINQTVRQQNGAANQPTSLQSTNSIKQEAQSLQLSAVSNAPPTTGVLKPVTSFPNTSQQPTKIPPLVSSILAPNKLPVPLPTVPGSQNVIIGPSPQMSTHARNAKPESIKRTQPPNITPPHLLNNPSSQFAAPSHSQKMMPPIPFSTKYQKELQKKGYQLTYCFSCTQWLKYPSEAETVRCPKCLEITSHSRSQKPRSVQNSTNSATSINNSITPQTPHISKNSSQPSHQPIQLPAPQNLSHQNGVFIPLVKTFQGQVQKPQIWLPPPNIRVPLQPPSNNSGPPPILAPINVPGLVNPSPSQSSGGMMLQPFGTVSQNANLPLPGSATLSAFTGSVSQTMTSGNLPTKSVELHPKPFEENSSTKKPKIDIDLSQKSE